MGALSMGGGGGAGGRVEGGGGGGPAANGDAAAAVNGHPMYHQGNYGYPATNQYYSVSMGKIH